MPTLSKAVEEAFRTLPSRYLGADEGFDATYHVRLGDVGHTWEIRCTPLGARVRMGATRREPDVVIGSDAETWLQLREGELSGIEAFSQRRLYARVLGARTVRGHLRRSLQQLKRQVEHEQLRVQAAARRQARTS